MLSKKPSSTNIAPDKPNFVGRAGHKLLHAINTFDININNLICADFGSAVGGFTDCLLQHGAKKVYAVETGYGVLDWKLRQNPKVTVLERTNAMHVTLPEKVDLITIDTSWTRQINIIQNALKNLKPQGFIISLIKPHYEADKSLLIHGLLPNNLSEKITNETIQKILDKKLTLIGKIKSPITGGKAENIEYLAFFQYC